MGFLDKIMGEETMKELRGQDKSPKKQVDKELKILREDKSKKDFLGPDQNRKILNAWVDIRKVDKMGFTHSWNMAISRSEILFFRLRGGWKPAIIANPGILFGAVGAVAWGVASGLVETGIRKILKKEKVCTIDSLISASKEHIVMPVSFFRELEAESKLFGKIIKFQHEGKGITFKLSNTQYKQALALCGVEGQN